VAESVPDFTIELERITEMVMMIIGNVFATLRTPLFTWQSLALTFVLFVLLPPAAVELSLAGSSAFAASVRSIT